MSGDPAELDVALVRQRPMDQDPVWLQRLGGVIDVLVVIAGSGIVVLMFANVVSRFAFRLDVAWSNEIATFLMMWGSFLGGAAAARRGAHLRLHEAVERVAPVPRAWVEAVVLGAVLFLLGQMIWFGALVSKVNMSQQTTVLYWPVGLLYAAMPVGAGLMLLFFAVDFARALRTIGGLRRGGSV